MRGKAPTRDELSRLYGMRVPSGLAVLASVLHEWARGSSEGLMSCDNVLGWVPGGPLRVALTEDDVSVCEASGDSGYSQTPPEMRLTGWMGVDGVHYGLVVHAPELESDECPFGEFSPMDDGGVFRVGATIGESVENEISWHMSLEGGFSGAQLELIGMLKAAFAIEPDVSKAMRRWGPNGNGVAVTPAIPRGWAHVPSADGVGTLAPAERFRDPSMRLGQVSAGDAISRADRDLRDGFAASALAWAREGYWGCWGGAGAEELRDRMSAAYRALGRVVLAGS